MDQLYTILGFGDLAHKVTQSELLAQYSWKKDERTNEMFVVLGYGDLARKVTQSELLGQYHWKKD